MARFRSILLLSLSVLFVSSCKEEEPKVTMADLMRQSSERKRAQREAEQAQREEDAKKPQAKYYGEWCRWTPYGRRTLIISAQTITLKDEVFPETDWNNYPGPFMKSFANPKYGSKKPYGGNKPHECAKMVKNSKKVSLCIGKRTYRYDYVPQSRFSLAGEDGEIEIVVHSFSKGSSISFMDSLPGDDGTTVVRYAYSPGGAKCEGELLSEEISGEGRPLGPDGEYHTDSPTVTKGQCASSETELYECRGTYSVDMPGTSTDVMVDLGSVDLCACSEGDARSMFDEIDTIENQLEQVERTTGGSRSGDLDITCSQKALRCP